MLEQIQRAIKMIPELRDHRLTALDCVNASRVNMFKNKVDTYLRRMGSIHN